METDDAPGSRWTGPTVLRAGGQTKPAKLAGAIARVLRAADRLQIEAIGAIAVYQMVTAVIIARRYLKDDGIDLEVAPTFADVVIDGEDRTAICFDITSRPGG